MAWRTILLATAIALTGCVGGEAAPDRVVEHRDEGPDAPRGAWALQDAMLRGHNAARRAVGVVPIAWDDALAKDALGYAQTLARTRKFEHSTDRGAQGENLWTGTRGAYSYDEMVGHWVAERAMYRPGPAPNFSSTGRGGDVAHYTQIVWRSTTRVGCATASSDRDDYLVCRYGPPGNVVGQRPF